MTRCATQNRRPCIQHGLARCGPFSWLLKDLFQGLEVCRGLVSEIPVEESNKYIYLPSYLQVTAFWKEGRYNGRSRSMRLWHLFHLRRQSTYLCIAIEPAVIPVSNLGAHYLLIREPVYYSMYPGWCCELDVSRGLESRSLLALSICRLVRCRLVRCLPSTHASSISIIQLARV